jgi:hypothetical protein
MLAMVEALAMAMASRRRGNNTHGRYRGHETVQGGLAEMQQ